MEKGFRLNLVDNELHGNFLSSQLVDSVRSSICFVIISDSSIIGSSLVNQEIGYAEGKGLKTILLVSKKVREELPGIISRITILEFTQQNFLDQCLSISEITSKISDIMEEPVDIEAFLEFYQKTRDETPS